MAWISNLLRTLRVKSTVQQNFFILVDLLKWLCHFINDLKNCLRDWFWKYISFILLHKWKIHLKKKGMIKKKKKTRRRRNPWKTERLHMIVVLWVADGTEQWHQETVPGSAEQRPRDPPHEHVPRCDIQCFTMGKKPQLIQKRFHKILTNVQQYLKNIKEDAQILSACTGSARWERL